MVLQVRSGLQLLRPKRPRQLLQWGGVFAVGFAAVAWRSFSGNFRTGLEVTHPKYTFRQFNLKAFSVRSALFSTIITASTSRMSLSPPQPPPNWTHTPENIARLTTEAIDNHRAVEDKIGGLSPSECTYESVSGS